LTPSRILSSWFHCLSFLIFTIYAVIAPQKKMVFSLAFSPLNVVVDRAVVDSENQTITLDTLDATITLPNFSGGRYRCRITLTGYVVVLDASQGQANGLTVYANAQPIASLLPQLTTPQYFSFFTTTTTTIQLKLDNFVIIENNPLSYGVILQNLEIEQW
jgi:hypothetical protein